MQLPILPVLELPTLGVLDSDESSDDASDVEVYQVPENLRAAKLPGVEDEHGEHVLTAALRGHTSTEWCSPAADAPGSKHAGVAGQHVSIGCCLQRGMPTGSKATAEGSTQTATTGLCRSRSISDTDAGMPTATISSSTSSSTSQLHDAAAGIPCSSTSSDSGSSSSSIDPDTFGEAFSNNSAPAFPGSSDLMLLNTGCLLNECDLDELLNRLTVAAAAAPARHTTSLTLQQPARRVMCGESSSEQFSSDDSSSSLHGAMAAGAADDALQRSSPPPVPSSYSAYEPPWQRQQQSAQQNSRAAPRASPAKQHTNKVWVPQQPAGVPDLRSAADKAAVAVAADAGVQQHAGCSQAGETTAGQAGGGAPRTGGRFSLMQGVALDDCSDSDDSSEEDWQQFRQQQHAKARMFGAL